MVHCNSGDVTHKVIFKDNFRFFSLDPIFLMLFHCMDMSYIRPLKTLNFATDRLSVWQHNGKEPTEE